MRAQVLLLLKSGQDSQDVLNCLRQSDYDLCILRHFEEAVGLLKNTHVDLIIIDMQMDSDGNVFDFMRWVKKNPLTIDTPFVMFSPPIKAMAKYIQDGIRISARMLGAAMFITMDRGFDGQLFRQQIDSLLPICRPDNFEIDSKNDIPVRRHLGEILNETQKRSQIASTVAEVGLWELNLESGKTWRSEKHDQIFGYLSMLPEWNFEIFLNHVIYEDRAYASAVFESVLETGYPLRMECRIIRSEETLRWISVQGETLRCEKGIPLRIMGTVADITDRKRCEDQHRVMVAIKERTEFAATLTHDMKTRLIGANRVLDLLLKECVGSLTNEQSELLQAMAESNSGALTSIRNLIDIYGLEFDDRSPVVSKVELNTVVISMGKKMHEITTSRGIKVEVEQPAQVICAKVDPIGLEKVMQNLLENALKYSPINGTIIIRLIDQERFAVIEIEDNGPGIILKDQKELFTRSSRTDPGKKYAVGGLGLYLSKMIMESNGGSIECDSQPNIRTIFRLTLPRESP